MTIRKQWQLSKNFTPWKKFRPQDKCGSWLKTVPLSQRAASVNKTHVFVTEITNAALAPLFPYINSEIGDPTTIDMEFPRFIAVK